MNSWLKRNNKKKFKLKKTDKHKMKRIKRTKKYFEE